MDVAVVGGGPAGLLAATQCAEAGLDVLLFEEHSVIGEPTHCTGVISLETAELVKVPDEIILSRLGRALLHAPSGRSCEIVWEGDDREQILVIDRGAFDRDLAARAADAGVVIGAKVRVDRATGDAGAALDRVLARPDVRRRLLSAPDKAIRRLLPLRPISRTYTSRVLVV